MRLVALGASAITLTAAFTFGAALADIDPPSIPRDAIRVSVGGAVGAPAARGFLGLSIEFKSILNYLGRDPAAVNPTFVQLVRNLDPGQAPVIRIGGDSTDWTWAAASGVARPPGVRYTLGPRWIAVVRAAAVALGARLIVGVNFEADSRTIAGVEARALLHGLGASVEALELGNEPEVYGALGWYRTATGVEVPGRSRGYGIAGFVHDYASVVGALGSSVPLAGPATGSRMFISALGRFVRSEPRVRIVTVHRYPLNRCFSAPGSPEYPTIANLLAPSSSRGLANALAAPIATAHRLGRTLRVDELNSVACAGKSGISDTFASSLWVLDTLFALARVGADGVNIHTLQTGAYAPFQFRYTSGRWEAQVKPIYYGMLMFARAAPPGSRLLKLSAPAWLHAWAARAPDGRVRVVFINESARRGWTVAVRVPNAGALASLQRLSAPALTARAGVTIDAQRFAPRTSTGKLTGTATAISLTKSGNRFVARVPPHGAVLLTAPLAR